MRNLSNYSLVDLISEYQKKSSLIHSDYYSFGSEFLLRKEKALAKQALIESANYILVNDFYNENHPYNRFDLDRITSALSLNILMTEFDLVDMDVSLSAIALTYLEISKWINENPNDYDSHRCRALLLMKNKFPIVLECLLDVKKYGNVPGSFKLLLFTDLYLAATLPESEYTNLMPTALKIYAKLSNIKIDSRIVSEMSLKELSNFGLKFHTKLLNNLNKNYLNGEFKISKEDLERIVLLKPMENKNTYIIDF